MGTLGVGLEESPQLLDGGWLESEYVLDRIDPAASRRDSTFVHAKGIAHDRFSADPGSSARVNTGTRPGCEFAATHLGL